MIIGGGATANRPVLYHTFLRIAWEIHIIHRIFKRNTYFLLKPFPGRMNYFARRETSPL